jgi:hypothetical protein
MKRPWPGDSRRDAANPHASFLYLAPTRGYNGWRLTLTVREETSEAGDLEKFKEEAREKSIPIAGPALTTVVYFKVDEVRPLT